MIGLADDNIDVAGRVIESSDEAIPALCRENLQHFAFEIDSSPEIVHLAVDLHKDLVEMSSPSGIRGIMKASPPDLCDEHRTDPVPPQPYAFVANVDTALEQQIFDLFQ